MRTIHGFVRTTYKVFRKTADFEMEFYSASQLSLLQLNSCKIENSSRQLFNTVNSSIVFLALIKRNTSAISGSTKKFEVNFDLYL